ncbi:MAG: photosynthetic reaction center subunit H [Pseudomonadota bacterium]
MVEITEYIDAAQVLLYVFWAFFAALVYYLVREGKREGYPLVYDGEQNRPYTNFPSVPDPKRFLLHDGEVVEAPGPSNERENLKLAPSAKWQGAPFIPTGDPMLDGVGPGSYAMRKDVPDRLPDGELKIVPMRNAPSCSISSRDSDPRGMDVIGADERIAGKVRDVWLDQGEFIIRYLEVEVEDQPAKRVLLPIMFADISSNRNNVRVSAILADQFANVPALAKPDQVTFLEEDRICGYYGAGTLYAWKDREEPLL